MPGRHSMSHNDAGCYGHFCLLTRTLERIGDRGAMLVVRDLATGPKRFTDLMDRLGGDTTKTLTRRPCGLERDGLVEVDRAPGRALGTRRSSRGAALTNAHAHVDFADPVRRTGEAGLAGSSETRSVKPWEQLSFTSSSASTASSTSRRGPSNTDSIQRWETPSAP